MNRVTQMAFPAAGERSAEGWAILRSHVTLSNVISTEQTTQSQELGECGLDAL